MNTVLIFILIQFIIDEVSKIAVKIYRLRREEVCGQEKRKGDRGKPRDGFLVEQRSVVGRWIDARLATGGWFWCRSKDGRAAPSSSLRSLLSPLLVLSLRLYKGGTVLCESVRPKSIFRFRKDLACTTRHSRLTALLSIRPTVEGCLCLSLPFYPL